METIRYYWFEIALAIGGVLLVGLLVFMVVNQPTRYTTTTDQTGRVCFVPNNHGQVICVDPS